MRQPVASPPVVTFPFRGSFPSVFAEQLIGTLDILPLAFAIFQQDQFERRIDRDLQFYPTPMATARVITPDQRTEYLMRAMTAMALGDPMKREVMHDMGAMAILRGVVRGAANGTITKDNPLSKLDLTTAKAIAKLAVEGALAYAAGNPLRPATDRPVHIGTKSGAVSTKESRQMAEESTGNQPDDTKPTDEPKPADTTGAGDQKPADTGNTGAAEACSRGRGTTHRGTLTRTNDQTCLRMLAQGSG